MDDEIYLRNNKWSLDRGRWIYDGDTSCGYSLEMAVRRQQVHDAAVAKDPWWAGSQLSPPIH